MKNTIYLFLLLSLAACSGGDGKYNAAIEDAVLGSVTGDRSAHRFRIVETQQQGTVTVADSIRIITEEFDGQRTRDIETQQTLLDMRENLLASAGRFTPESEKQQAQTAIDEIRDRIDSLKSATPAASLEKYSGRKKSEVLADIIRCRYEVLYPLSGAVVQETFDFWCSPDRKEVYQKKKAR